MDNPNMLYAARAIRIRAAKNPPSSLTLKMAAAGFAKCWKTLNIQHNPILKAEATHYAPAVKMYGLGLS
jgi:hypothetical protein